VNYISLLETASFKPVSLAQPNAWVGHLPFAAWLIKTIQPGIFVELGTHTGNSYFSFCQAIEEAKLATKCYSVDTWQGEEHAGYYDESVYQQVNTHNQQNYAHFSSLLRMTFDEAASLLKTRVYNYSILMDCIPMKQYDMILKHGSQNLLQVPLFYFMTPM